MNALETNQKAIEKTPDFYKQNFSPESETVTRFGLKRHAQTEWNRLKRIQGQKDSPLTRKGERQAVRWGHLLQGTRWDRILTSDIGRARKTADFINGSLQIPIRSEPGLREQSWGRWTGYTISELKQRFPRELDEQIRRGWRFCPPGGESRHQVWQRSAACLHECTQRWPGQTILVVTHEGIIRTLIYRLSSRRFLPDEPALLLPGHLHWLAGHITSPQLVITQINALPL